MSALNGGEPRQLDRPGDAEIHYAQERQKVGSTVSGLRVLLEEIE